MKSCLTYRLAVFQLIWNCLQSLGCLSDSRCSNQCFLASLSFSRLPLPSVNWGCFCLNKTRQVATKWAPVIIEFSSGETAWFASVLSLYITFDWLPSLPEFVAISSPMKSISSFKVWSMAAEMIPGCIKGHYTRADFSFGDLSAKNHDQPSPDCNGSTSWAEKVSNQPVLMFGYRHARHTWTGKIRSGTRTHHY